MYYVKFDKKLMHILQSLKLIIVVFVENCYYTQHFVKKNSFLLKENKENNSTSSAVVHFEVKLTFFKVHQNLKVILVIYYLMHDETF